MGDFIKCLFILYPFNIFSICLYLYLFLSGSGLPFFWKFYTRKFILHLQNWSAENLILLYSFRSANGTFNAKWLHFKTPEYVLPTYTPRHTIHLWQQMALSAFYLEIICTWNFCCLHCAGGCDWPLLNTWVILNCFIRVQDDIPR